MSSSAILLVIYLTSLTFGVFDTTHDMFVILKNYRKIEIETSLLNYKIRNGIIILAFVLTLIEWVVPVINTISVVMTLYELFKNPNRYDEDYIVNGVIENLQDIRF